MGCDILDLPTDFDTEEELMLHAGKPYLARQFKLVEPAMLVALDRI